MPSFLEILDGDGAAAPEDGSNGPEAPPDILASVKAEGGRRRRRRHRRNLVVSGIAAVALAVPALALLPEDGGDRDDVLVAATPDRDADADRDTASPVTTIASGTPQTTIVAPAAPTPTETTPEPTPTTVRPAPTTVPPTTAPALVCGNSTDPACGDFYWDPAPGANGALSLRVDPDPVPPFAPGETRTIVVHWSDPDATLFYSDNDADGVLLADACAAEARYGPWAPPSPTGGSGTFSFEYTAPATAGPDVVTVYASTATDGGCEYDPYRSFDNLSIPITVQ